MSLLGMSVGMSSLVPTVRPKRIAVGIAAMVGIVGTGVVVTPQRSAAIAEAAMRMADPMALLDARSPGRRPAGALYQTKPDRPGGETWSPTGRPQVPVSETADVPLAYVPVAGVPIDGVLEPAGGIAFEGGPLPLADGFVGTGGLSGVGGGGGIGGVVIGGGGGGGGMGGGPGNPSNPGGGTTPTPTSPVPEPATWLTMVLGFGIMGSALRRRRAFVPA